MHTSINYNAKELVALMSVIIIELLPSAITVCKADSLDSIRYFSELRTTFSNGENTPFWLVNNLQGLGSPEKNNGYVRAAAFKDLDKSKKFSWGVGIDLTGGWHQTAPFSIHQLYGEMKYRCLSVLVGSKEIWGDFNNPRLSSGNLLYAGNAMPIPQIRVGIFDYADFWGTNGWLGAKGYVAYGRFTDSKWQKAWANKNFTRTENVLYHSKGIWFRGGNSAKYPLVAELGIEMATQFGGKSYQKDGVVKCPTGFTDWLKAFFPSSGNSSTLTGEQTNIQGNMVGAYNISLSWLPHDNWSAKFYFEHYFEDHSQMTFEYGWKDGLIGIEIRLPKNPIISGFVYEYIHSKDQTGAVNHDKTDKIPEQVSGRDNYYTHYIYGGWQHWGMGIGNPLIISPIYNNDHKLTFTTTRIIGHHLGFEGDPSKEIKYRVLLSFSRNWGTYTYPTPEILTNFNCLFEVSWKPKLLKGWYGSLGIAGDSGDLLGKSYGIMLSIGKTGVFNF